MKQRQTADPAVPEMSHSAQVARRFVILFIALAVLLLWGLVLNVNAGSVKIPAGDVFTMVFKAAGYRIANLFTGGNYAAALEEVINTDRNSKIISASASRACCWPPSWAAPSRWPAS